MAYRKQDCESVNQSDLNAFVAYLKDKNAVLVERARLADIWRIAAAVAAVGAEELVADPEGAFFARESAEVCLVEAVCYVDASETLNAREIAEEEAAVGFDLGDRAADHEALAAAIYEVAESVARESHERPLTFEAFVDKRRADAAARRAKIRGQR